MTTSAWPLTRPSAIVRLWYAIVSFVRWAVYGVDMSTLTQRAFASPAERAIYGWRAPVDPNALPPKPIKTRSKALANLFPSRPQVVNGVPYTGKEGDPLAHLVGHQRQVLRGIGMGDLRCGPESTTTTRLEAAGMVYKLPNPNEHGSYWELTETGKAALRRLGLTHIHRKPEE